MRSFLVAFAGLMLLATGAAQAKVSITVDKDNQMMTVAVDGVERYHWPVSTGIPSRETPSGTFRAFRMEEDHYSKEFDDAPMPHSIFFTKIGHAIHGTESESKLGMPASHGCVRLSRENAATLYALVEQEGVLNTTVTLTGSAAVALARHPGNRPVAVARRDAPLYAPQYDSAGDPTVLSPQQAAPDQYQPQYQPYQQPQYQQPQYQQPQYQQRADDGYIHPADGSPDVAQYPAPRSMRRGYDAQGYRQPRYRYYDNRGYYEQQQNAPQPYQPRGLFD